MAFEGKAIPNQNVSITFTLPISCQICLGKVKKPVLCPNHHVFCNLCLEIWLKRNSQCPACRVDIGPDNPVRHIIGGQIEDEDSAKKSTPEIRRARFDLLYQEYEDQLKQLRTDNMILRTENNFLIAQLKDAEDKNDNHDKGKDKKPTMSAPSAQTFDGPNLLVLTKNLQEVQKLYMNIKTDLSELKQENCKLKDENVHLTRENENLRLEIAQRSPKKFGRYTVATLETKIAEQKTEIRQLKKALERSDSYIEELHCQQENFKSRIIGKTYEVETAPGSKPRFQINLEPKHSAEENCSVKNGAKSADGPCKVLFGKVLHGETAVANPNMNVFSASLSSPSAPKKHGTQFFDVSHVCRTEHEVESQADPRNKPCISSHVEAQNTAHHHPEHADSRNKTFVSSHAEMHKTGHHQPESLMKPSIGASESHTRKTDSRGLQGEIYKRVHFNILGKPNDTSSFDLEAPSPVSSPISDSYSSVNKDLQSPSQASSTQADPSSKYDIQVKVENVSDFDEKVMNLLQENTASVDRKPTTWGHLSGLQTSWTSEKINKVLVKTKKFKRRRGGRKRKSWPQDATNSSHLSLPGLVTAEKVDDLNDTSDFTGHDNDLDISMTPELTDCLELMNQAEKKVSVPISSETIFSAAYAQSSNSTTVPVQQPENTNFKRPSLLHKHLPASTENNGQWFASSGSRIVGWEKQFYSAFGVNPYKYNKVDKSHNFSVGLKQNPPNNNYGETGCGQVYSSVDFNPTKEPVIKKDFKFSDPIKVSRPSSNLPNHAVGISSFNQLNLCLKNPSSSSGTSFLPAQSPAYNFTAPTSAKKGSSHPSSSSQLASIGLSSHSEFKSVVDKTGKHTANLSSSFLDFPSTSTQNNNTNNNSFSISLSTSEIDWPECA